MPVQSKMILDSVSPDGVRLTTMELTYPLIVHNELLTHRSIGKSDSSEYDEWLEFSRNSSSNRAIPSERLIAQVLDDPYFPKNPRYSASGMIPGEYMNQEDKEKTIQEWLDARIDAVERVRRLQELKLAKQWRNRIIGPWQWITVVATANEEHWNHFFNLRNHFAAQDEIHEIAAMAQTIYDSSRPKLLAYGLWHTPYVTKDEILFDSNISVMSEDHLDNLLKEISVARCARTSFLRQDEVHKISEDISLFHRLYGAMPPHGSPFEHVAQSTTAEVRSGNFVGYNQFRKMLKI